MSDETTTPTSNQEKLEQIWEDNSVADGSYSQALILLNRNAPKSQVREAVREGLKAQYHSMRHAEEVYYSLNTEQAEKSERGQVPFGNTLHAGVFEKLKAAQWAEDESINNILERALRRELQRMEIVRSEPFEIYPPHTIDESKYE